MVVICERFGWKCQNEGWSEVQGGEDSEDDEYGEVGEDGEGSENGEGGEDGYSKGVVFSC